MIVSIRLRAMTVRICLAHLLLDYRIAAARHAQQACAWVAHEDVDLIVANSALPFWDVQVIEEVARSRRTELLMLDEKRWPEDLSTWIDRALQRRCKRAASRPKSSR